MYFWSFWNVISLSSTVSRHTHTNSGGGSKMRTSWKGSARIFCYHISSWIHKQLNQKLEGQNRNGATCSADWHCNGGLGSGSQEQSGIWTWKREQHNVFPHPPTSKQRKCPPGAAQWSQLCDSSPKCVGPSRKCPFCNTAVLQCTIDYGALTWVLPLGWHTGW